MFSRKSDDEWNASSHIYSLSRLGNNLWDTREVSLFRTFFYSDSWLVSYSSQYMGDNNQNGGNNNCSRTTDMIFIYSGFGCLGSELEKDSKQFLNDDESYKRNDHSGTANQIFCITFYPENCHCRSELYIGTFKKSCLSL